MDQLVLFDYDQLDLDTRSSLKQRAERINERSRKIAVDIWEIGREFAEAQKELAQSGPPYNGLFLKWAESETGYNYRTVYRYIDVYNSFKLDKLSSLRVATSALYALAAPSTPEEARQEAIERAESGETITHQKAQGIIAAHHFESEIVAERELSPRSSSVDLITRADRLAKEGEGYTEEEWAKEPESYIGDCFKQCYAPRLMVKGDVLEYGVRGVYICTGCGYAWPPMMPPPPVDLDEYNQNLVDPEEQDLPEQSFNYKRDNKANQAKDIYTPQGYDACQTPPYALDPILPYLNRDWLIWEPAAGEGYLVEGFYDSGFRETQVIGTDLLTGQNFFDFTPDHWDCLVTNPPYSIKYDWLGRCYQLGKPFALLVPVETLGAKTAQLLLKKYGFEMMLLDQRVDFKMPIKGWDSSAQFPTFWLCWQVLPEKVMFGELQKEPPNA